jgi:hypothetical protein
MNIESLRAEIATDIARLQAAYDALANSSEVPNHAPVKHRKTTRTMIAKGEKKGIHRVRREMTPELRARISASQKARWAKQKAAVATVEVNAAQSKAA